MSYQFNFPTVVTKAGLQPQDPDSLRTQLLAAATAASPGITLNLPGSLIEDISSTDVAAVVLIDQAKVEAVNSISPNAANEALLTQLGQLYGVYQGQSTNTSVPVVFASLSGGLPVNVGYVIPNGTLVNDGTHVYQVQGGGVIGANGLSQSLTAIAVNAGTFGVPANTVTTIQSTIPAGIVLTVNNPLPGNPGGDPEPNYAFQARVWQAGLAACVGGPRFIKTLIGQVLGTQANLISVQATAAGLRIVVGGAADNYQIAYAIFSAVADGGATLQGSAINAGRNVVVALNDYPDTYPVKFVRAVVQNATMNVVWNTTVSSFTGGAAFPSLTQQALADYLNSIPVGNPINVLEMNNIFQAAVAPLLDPTLLTRLVFQVSINGVLVNPAVGTYAVSGDPEGYFFATPGGILVAQG